MVFYRKYRPQSLEELVGQSQIKETLLKAFQSQKLAHAYLFCGPKGTGKTSTARILAKMVNCEVSDKAPCNTCSSCLSITDGSNLDLIEIDAASNRGIDDIRDLREKIKLAPTSSQKKVYIIDEVHMLSTDAFNALLKTLEEPPAHVLFILATTELHKIPATILSRVQKLEFKTPTNEELKEALLKVVEGEKLTIEDEKVFKLLAERAEGSFRDGIKLLDQLASQGQKITVELVENNLNISKSEDIQTFLDYLSKKDSVKALELVNKQVNSGVNLKEFILSVLESLRNTLIHGETSQFSLKEQIRLIETLVKALEQMKFVSISSLPLEVAVVESCMEQNPIVSNQYSVDSSQKLVTPPHEVELKGNAQTIKLTKVIQEGYEVGDEELRGKTKELLTPTFSTPTIADISTIDDVASSDMITLRDKWQFILETVKPYNYSLEALLKQVNIISCEGGLVVLEVPYTFHQRILEAPKSRTLLESVFADVLGKNIKVTCALGKRPTKVEELANVELAADDEIIKVAAEIFNSN